jgi:hypothetical protein
MKKFKEKKTIWIGLAKVSQVDRPGALGDADMAYTNVVGLARNRAGFRMGVKRSLESVQLQLLRLEDVETLQQRLKNHTVHDDVLAIAQTLNEDEEIAFDVFATFDA